MSENSLRAEWNKLISSEFNCPNDFDQALYRINTFTITYQNLIFAANCLSFILLTFFYYPFLWVISVTPLPFIIYKVLLTKKYGLTKIMSEVEESEVMLVCGMVGAYVAYCCHALIPMVLCTLFPLLICVVLGSLHKSKQK